MQSFLDWAHFPNHRNLPPSWVAYSLLIQLFSQNHWSRKHFSLISFLIQFGGGRVSAHECVTFFKIFNGNWFWVAIDIQQIAEHGEKDPVFILPWTIIIPNYKMFYILVLSTSNDLCKCSGYIFCISTQDSFMPYYTSWQDTFGLGTLSQRSKGFVKGNQPFCEDSRFCTRNSGEHDYLLYFYGKICFWRSRFKFSILFV